MDSYPSVVGRLRPDRNANAAASKFRVRFSKSGDMRFISHHDLMHCVERMFRRANISLRTTQGFNPRPRIVYALSLALGVVGCCEVFEAETANETTADNLQYRLSQQTPPGLHVLSVSTLAAKQSAKVAKIGYRLRVDDVAGADVEKRIADRLHQTEWWVERMRRNLRRIDLRPAVARLEVVDGCLEVELFVCANGTPRPEEILDILELRHLLNKAHPLERYLLELKDEVATASDGIPEQLPVQKGKHPKQKHGSSDRDTSDTTSKTPESLIPGPMSFDS